MNTDRLVHLLQFFGLLITGVILIIFANEWINPEVVYTSLIASVCSVVGARIIANGYHKE